ncbi:hypothetical protein LTR84_003153 [Exophiala bonariae]|uniref:NB-ARC domain-containing protein n=1 Tax=Exophiala bonariae TaxID=1690606 RepID=A0AAV9N886_9EURO|nr:hypothetical protein LTR84_003153 [Exophiala bonariae]
MADANKRHQEFLQRFDQLEKNLANHTSNEPIEPRWPVHWRVSRSPNALFTGRDDILEELEACVQSALNGPHPSQQSRSLIFGIGGQGKSEICLQLVQHVHNLFWGIFWVDVSTTSAAESAFLDIGKRLNSSGSTWQDGREALANASKPWILILDNADDPDIDYQDYFPSSPRGAVLMTSRNKENQHYVTDKTIALEGLPVNEAQELLLKAADIKEHQRAAVQEDSLKVAELLQSHPLALTLAGAYIRAGHCTLARYPAEFVRQRKRLLQYKARQAKSRYADVYATFEASIETLQKAETESARDALELLPVLAVCAPNVLPMQLFEMAWRGAQSDNADNADKEEPLSLGQWHVDQLMPMIQVDSDQWDPFRLMEAVRILETFALLSTNMDTDSGRSSVSMHPLVHAWARDRQEKHSQHDSWIKMGCIVAFSSEEKEAWTRHERLRAHVEALTSWDMHCMFASDPPMHVTCILHQCGWQLRRMRSDAHLSVLLKRLLAHLGLNDSTIDQPWLGLYSLQAENCDDRGDFREAITLCEEVLKVQSLNLPDGHPHRLSTQHRLASTNLDNGQFREAISLLEHIVSIRERTLREDHPHLLESQHELASAYLAQGQVEEAISLLEHIVSIQERTLVEEHSDRLVSQHELASAYVAHGQVEETISLLEHIGSINQRTLVEEHPHRLASQHELARVYLAHGQVEEAISLLEHIVSIGGRTLSEDHPNRLSSQHELARAYYQNGRTQEALSLERKVVQIQAQTLSKDHPDRLKSEHNIATHLWRSGHTHEGRQLMEHVVMVRQSVLNENHPDLVNSQDWLKLMRDEMQWSEGEEEKEIDGEQETT